MAIAKQSLTELRALAQSMGVKWAFSDSPEHLRQKISQRQVDMLPPVPLPTVPVPEDQRLRTKPPSKVSDEQMMRDMLAPYIAKGLQLSITNDQFQMSYGKRTDSGTLRQPPRVILNCAARLFQ